MGTPRIHLRISDDANDALKKVVAKFSKWSLAQLGDTLLLESCRAILSEKAPNFPTVDYIRHQIRIADMESAQAVLIEAASKTSRYNDDEAPAARAAEKPDKKQQAARKHAA